jgi:hypothetical protein
MSPLIHSLTICITGVPIFIDTEEEHRTIPFLPDSENKFFQKLVVDDPEKFAEQKQKEGYYVIVLFHTAASIYTRVPWADYNIARTMWEMDTLPSSWADGINTMDEVWVRTKLAFHCSILLTQW